ncbi:hypothetical protein SEA_BENITOANTONIO_85 [Arthrobacter phage BenitoAntonio]|uniref:HNH endonuclease n=1 Tax=Arthrobacter phage KeaneyLin TaxID=2250412 RepID=A0A345KMG8_9CAUD|nr:HNH endonuclease [Arthrobacter phage KeaneyLin]AXH44220.1 hypothetical protein SEA_KEANEYLIN_82 [Arthrobacter phage KeaneyLin]UYL87348.1 hypothetical protein SEA_BENITOANTONIO_85 [Arthrobacter phage BenitoAntonio]
MIEVWRTIAEFPMYEIEKTSKQIRNIHTKRILKPNKPHMYGLRKDFKYYMRSANILHADTFIRPHDDGSLWRTVPEFENYEMNEDGEVRHKRSLRKLFKMWYGNVDCVNFWRDGKTHTRSVSPLLRKIWSEEAA